MKKSQIKLQQFVEDLSSEDLWRVFSLSKNELRQKGLVRTNNITGERGEFLAEQIYNETPGLSNLQKAPEGTQNVDALSRKGERYSIKTITLPGKTTGVFYGIEKDDKAPEKKFEYVIIVLLDKYLDPVNLYQLTWNNFLKHKKWHSRMRAFNLSITKSLISDSKKIL